MLSARHLKYALYVSIIFLLWSCGESDVTAPPEAVITVNPASVSIDDGSAAFGQTFHTHYFTITVSDDQGRPIRDAKILISYQWAWSDAFAPITPIFLCSSTEETGIGADTNANGVGDCNPALSPMTAHTDEFGTYLLRFDFSLGVPGYKADIEVRSGENFGTSTFEVKVTT
jgi:hypothetical protein